MNLLRMHRDTAIQAGIEHEPEDVEEVRERIARRIEKLQARRAAAAAAAAEEG